MRSRFICLGNYTLLPLLFADIRNSIERENGKHLDDVDREARRSFSSSVPDKRIAYIGRLLVFSFRLRYISELILIHSMHAARVRGKVGLPFLRLENDQRDFTPRLPIPPSVLSYPARYTQDTQTRPRLSSR